jgi:hypothetical protein
MPHDCQYSDFLPRQRRLFCPKCEAEHQAAVRSQQAQGTQLLPTDADPAPETTTGEDNNEPKIYHDIASAQAAMDRGETVRIAMYSWEINPALRQVAQDIQDRQRLNELKALLHQEQQGDQEQGA